MTHTISIPMKLPMSDGIHRNEYMLGLFQFIEENISAEFNIELLSSVGYVSRGKLKNDF